MKYICGIALILCSFASSAETRPIPFPDIDQFDNPQIQSLFASGAFKEAEMACTKVLVADPKNKWARAFRAGVYYARDELKEMENDVTYLMHHHPKFSAGYAGMAMLSLKLPRGEKTNLLIEWLQSDDVLKREAAIGALEYAIEKLRSIQQAAKY